jgi:hypothetical protein
MIGAVSTAAVTLSAGALAQQAPFGTVLETRAMLNTAVTAVKADKTKALAM